MSAWCGVWLQPNLLQDFKRKPTLRWGLNYTQLYYSYPGQWNLGHWTLFRTWKSWLISFTRYATCHLSTIQSLSGQRNSLFGALVILANRGILFNFNFMRLHLALCVAIHLISCFLPPISIFVCATQPISLPRPTTTPQFSITALLACRGIFTLFLATIFCLDTLLSYPLDSNIITDSNNFLMHSIS